MCSKFQIICFPRFQIVQILNVLNFLQMKQCCHFGNSLMATECTVDGPNDVLFMLPYNFICVLFANHQVILKSLADISNYNFLTKMF